jgi:hypothetical protein
MADDSIAHLLRRAGFGASSDDLAIFDRLSYNAAVDRLLNYTSVPDDVDSKIGQAGFMGTTSNGAFSPNTVINDARQRWLFRMVHSNRPLQEWGKFLGNVPTAAAAGTEDKNKRSKTKPNETSAAEPAS